MEVNIFIARFDFPSIRSENQEKEMEAVGGSGSSEVENDLEMKLLRDRFRLSAISIAESQVSKNGMEVSKVVVACVADLAFKYTAHRNEHLSGLLRTFSNDLKVKDRQYERKRKKEVKKNDKTTI
ncbi:protein MHF1 homolog isoform X3 [Cicer arietinum]|uniref:protein MHF1 homolog isoform X3 n=1 Tax=Cicer arietinum TaxID=3827 RepID=UPI003CC5B149